MEGEQEALVAPTAARFDAAGELPYTFPCPSTHAEFIKLLSSSGIKEPDTVTVVKRIRTLYHPGLAEGNKEKMQVFANVLLDHVIYLAASASPTAYETINSILPPLLTLSHSYPLTCAPHYVKKIGLMHKNLLRGLIKGPLEPSAKTWPGAPELTLLRLVGMVWSTSDLSHPVAAPALLLISEYLSQSRIRSLADIASGLFLCSLVAQYEEMSHRLVPEALNFLSYAIAVLLPTSPSIVSRFPGSFPTPDLGEEHIKTLKLRSDAALTPNVPVDLAGALNATAAKGRAKSSRAVTDQLKVDLASASFKLVEEYRSMYSDSEAFIELFTPVERILGAVKAEKVPKPIAVRLPCRRTRRVRTKETDTFRRIDGDVAGTRRSLAGNHLCRPVACSPAAAAPQADPARDLPAEVRRGLQPEPPLRPGLGARRGEQAAGAVPQGEEGCCPGSPERQPFPRRRGVEAEAGGEPAVREEGSSRAPGYAFFPGMSSNPSMPTRSPRSSAVFRTSVPRRRLSSARRRRASDETRHALDVVDLFPHMLSYTAFFPTLAAGCREFRAQLSDAHPIEDLRGARPASQSGDSIPRSHGHVRLRCRSGSSLVHILKDESPLAAAAATLRGRRTRLLPGEARRVVATPDKRAGGKLLSLPPPVMPSSRSA